MNEEIRKRIALREREITKKEKWMEQDIRELQSIEFHKIGDVEFADDYIRRIRERMEAIEQARAVINELESLLLGNMLKEDGIAPDDFAMVTKNAAFEKLKLDEVTEALADYASSIRWYRKKKRLIDAENRMN